MGSPRHPAQASKGAARQGRALRPPSRLLAAPLLCCTLLRLSVVGFKHTGRAAAGIQPADQSGWGQHYQEVMGLFDLPLHLAGAIVPVIAANPLQVVKVHQQSSNAHPGRSAVAVARTIFERDGAKGFLRGVSPALVGIVPAILSHGLVYFMMKQVVSRGAWSGERHGDLTELLCTSAAILAQNIVTNPIGMIQTRMQLGSDPAGGCFTCWPEVVRSILKDEGAGGFYKGLLASCLRCGENLMVFTMCGRLNIWLKNRQALRRAAKKGLFWKLCQKICKEPVPESHTRVPLIAYVAIKLVGMLVTYPFEVVRTRQREQAQNGVSKYEGLRRSLSLIGKEEGLRGLYAGAGAHLARVAIGAASLRCLEWYGKDVVLILYEKRISSRFVERLDGFFETLPEPLSNVVGYVVAVSYILPKLLAIMLVTTVSIMPEGRPGPNAWPM